MILTEPSPDPHLIEVQRFEYLNDSLGLNVPGRIFQGEQVFGDRSDQEKNLKNKKSRIVMLPKSGMHPGAGWLGKIRARDSMIPLYMQPGLWN